jgi:hypothetical protein
MSARPDGQITRGKTARNRLRRADLYLLTQERRLLAREDDVYKGAWFVDLGYGAEPFTTLESSARLRQANPNLRLLGVEIDPERVTAALPYTDKTTQFRLGGFNLPREPGEGVRAIRAFNVLRQYERSEVAAVHEKLVAQLLPGGLLMEGTSDPFGRVWTANLIRRKSDSPNEHYLLFSTNFRWGFEPGLFQPVLPKNYIHQILPGKPIYEFMQAWKAAALGSIAVKPLGLRQWFIASAEGLAERGFAVDVRKKLLTKGFLLWRCPA